jgi:hypothetical protein
MDAVKIFSPPIDALKYMKSDTKDEVYSLEGLYPASSEEIEQPSTKNLSSSVMRGHSQQL